MPTYRRPELLRRAILSVTQQSYQNIQVKIFDNASGDTTEDVVRSISQNDSRVEYFCHPQNIGMLSNFKFAFSKVDTPYFAFLTDDDLLEKDCYKNAVQVLEHHPEIMFVTLGTIVVNENLHLVSREQPVSNGELKLYCTEDRFDAMHSGQVPLTCIAMVFRKEIAQIYTEMDDKFDVGSDIRFLFYAAAKYNFAYLSKVGAIVMCHSESFSVIKNNFNVLHQAIQISRYVEICNDKSISSYVKERSLVYLKRLLSDDYVKPMVRDAFMRLIVCICNPTELNTAIVEGDIKNSKNSGFAKTSLILQMMYCNALFRIAIRMLVGGYYANKKAKRKLALQALELSAYKEIFAELRKINVRKVR